MATYGFAPSFLKTTPELKALVAKATKAGWEIDKFLDAVKTTKWWKRRSDAEKRYDVMARENPGQVRDMIKRAAAALDRLAYTLGVPLTAGGATALARSQVRHGLSDAEMRDILGSRYKRFGDLGLAGQAKADIKKFAGDFGVPLSTPGLNSQVQKVVRGLITPEDMEALYREQAKRAYSAIAGQLDKGFTTRQILDPYLQIASQELGVNPSTLSIAQGKWNAPIQYRAKAAEAPRAMTFDEWTSKIRTDVGYGWDKTQGAQQKASQLATQLSEAFGAR